MYSSVINPGMWIRKFDFGSGFGSTKMIDFGFGFRIRIRIRIMIDFGFGFRQNFKSLIWEKLLFEQKFKLSSLNLKKTRYLPTYWTVADCTTTPRRLCHLVPTFLLYLLLLHTCCCFVHNFIRSVRSIGISWYMKNIFNFSLFRKVHYLSLVIRARKKTYIGETYSQIL